jgi:hypothetical protein
MNQETKLLGQLMFLPSKFHFCNHVDIADPRDKGELSTTISRWIPPPPIYSPGYECPRELSVDLNPEFAQPIGIPL